MGPLTGSAIRAYLKNVLMAPKRNFFSVALTYFNCDGRLLFLLIASWSTRLPRPLAE